MLLLTIAGQTETIEETESLRAEAMRRLFAAKQAGDTTAQLRRDDVQTTPQEPATPAGQVSQVAVERIQRDEAAAVRAGFAMRPPVYAPGTRVLPLGDDNLRLERVRVERMPQFADSAGRVAAAIAAEQRMDVAIDAADLRMTDDGFLSVPWQGARYRVGIEADAFPQFCERGGFGVGTRYLADLCGAPLRAHNVNEQLTTRGAGRLVLRTRRGHEGGRALFATVTPKYTAVDTDVVLGSVVPLLADARTELRYDGTGAKATALWMPDRVVDMAAGDVFKAGVRISTDDTGRGKIRISAVLFRNLCLNLIIIDEAEVETFASIHRGARERILAGVQTGITAALGKIDHFLTAWGKARSTPVSSVKETLARWVKDRALVVPGRSQDDRDQAVEAMLRAWRKEPGNTLADAVNAVTRAAHENPMWGVDWQEEIERQASRLILLPR
jgi:hypothetical protein